MRLNIKFFLQIFLILILIIFVWFILNNLSINLSRTGIGFDFYWLSKPAGFSLAEKPLRYSPSDTYAWALFIGWINSLKVIFSSLIFATFIGILIGFARLNKNSFIGLISAGYITVIRQTPLLLQLMFWYFVGFLNLRNNTFLNFKNIINFSIQGIDLFGIKFSSEFSALLFGLSIFSSAFIAEVIRGGIQSVPVGQWEAFRSLGISEKQGFIKIIIPQALPAFIPGLTSQYLNLAKNSTLAIAIGYADIYAINDTIINQTGRAVECFIILLCSFLILNLSITKVMGIIDKSIMKTRI